MESPKRELANEQQTINLICQCREAAREEWRLGFDKGHYWESHQILIMMMENGDPIHYISDGDGIIIDVPDDIGVKIDELKRLNQVHFDKFICYKSDSNGNFRWAN